jgi:divalent metal cation (Fe/Co/Zn/Cd) transporter
MEVLSALSQAHRHGARVHSHPHDGPHRHPTMPRRSRPLTEDDRGSPGGDHAHGHERPHGQDHAHEHGGEQGHSHGLIDESIKRSREGIRAVSLSLAVLGVAALAQTVIYLASGSVALLADLIHNFGDALTAVPLGIAFALHSHVAERRAGLAVVAAIFASACVAGVEAVMRLIHPSAPTHLAVLALAGGVGFAANLIAARIRLGAGRRLNSPALIADGHHAHADAYVSLAVIASALAVSLGAQVADPIIGLAITAVILRITWQSWHTVRSAH